MSDTIAVHENVEATMRDGTVLRADLYRPAGGGPYPVLVCRTPYDKRMDALSRTGRYLAAHGYQCAIQDIRGRYASDGEFKLARLGQSATDDAHDGFDTVEWAAGLADSDGQVGVWGHSYSSWAIWTLAPTQPPHLKGIFGSGMGTRILDHTFGIFDLGRRFHWMYQQGADARRRSGAKFGPPSRDAADQEWYEVERYKWIWYLPLGDIPDEAFSTLTPLAKDYMRVQDVETWGFDTIHHKVNVPTCSVTGWYDRIIGTIDQYEGMEANGPPELKGKHRLIVGPWGHANANYVQHQGPMDFGPEANADYAELVRRWYDDSFKGIANGLAEEPPVKLFIMGENTWHHENEWPLARTRYTEFFLHSGGGANTVFGDGVLSQSAPGEEPHDAYRYDPRDPVMSLMNPDSQTAPRDQAPLAGRQDILVYQTPPLEQAVQVTGPVNLILWVASDAPDTDFTTKLIDVHPDGMAVNLTYGVLRCHYRDGYGTRAPPLKPGTAYELTVPLNPTGVLFGKGHRIRLDVSSSDFPNFDRNHNTGRDFWSDAELRPANQTVFHDAKRPSRLILPVIPR